MSDHPKQTRTRAVELVVFAKFAHPGVVRVLCSIPELDGVILDAEHGAFSEPDLETLTAFAALSGKLGIVRIAAADADLLARALDRGATGVMVPRVHSAEQVAATLSGARYSPSGVRGYDPNVAATAYGSGTNGDAPRIMVEIETRDALEQAAEIAAVGGVTDLFFGPADYARDIGEPPGAIFTDAVMSAIALLPARAARDSVGFGLFVDTVERARTAVDSGYSLLAVGTDSLFLREAAQAAARAMRP